MTISMFIISAITCLAMDWVKVHPAPVAAPVTVSASK